METTTVELDLTTTILEIVNFLILVWILKRFLYKPVLRVVEERRAAIKAELDDAQQRRDQAERLRSQYQSRMADWQRDLRDKEEALQREFEQRRSQALEELQKTLNSEREKARAVEQRYARELQEHSERAALELGAKFAASLLQAVSGPALEKQIVDLACKQLAELPESQLKALRRSVRDSDSSIQVTSAHELDPTQRKNLAAEIENALGRQAASEYLVDPLLIAGIRLSLGDWSLEANLQHELKGFADLAHESD